MDCFSLTGQHIAHITLNLSNNKTFATRTTKPFATPICLQQGFDRIRIYVDPESPADPGPTARAVRLFFAGIFPKADRVQVVHAPTDKSNHLRQVNAFEDCYRYGNHNGFAWVGIHDVSVWGQMYWAWYKCKDILWGSYIISMGVY